MRNSIALIMGGGLLGYRRWPSCDVDGSWDSPEEVEGDIPGYQLSEVLFPGSKSRRTREAKKHSKQKEGER